jgi:hypothetical protein
MVGIIVPHKTAKVLNEGWYNSKKIKIDAGTRIIIIVSSS